MRRSRRIAWWTAYGLGAAAVIAGLGWTSVRVVRLEREERIARIAAERQETMRAALWRLDFWLAPRLARESTRTWFDYEPYHPQTIAYNRLLEPIAEGEVLLPSPLLTFSSPFLVSHFQWRRSTGFTSPQIPSDAIIALETVGCDPVPSDPARRRRFELDVAGISADDLDRRLREHELAVERSVGDNSQWVVSPPQPLAQPSDSIAPDPKAKLAGQSRSSKRAAIEPEQDYKARQSVSNDVQHALEVQTRGAQQAGPASVSQQELRNIKGVLSPPPGVTESTAPAPATPVEVGTMVPIWLGKELPRLVLARRVRFDGETVLQGVLVDWPALRGALLAQVEAIAPGADLEPVDELLGDDARRLASLPVILRLAPDEAPDEVGLAEHPAALGLALVWCAAFGAIGATGLALRSSIGSAVRTSRFASSVTHELRTPLTTFRLYAEMLADGLVPDETKRHQYFVTLRDESARLGLLVENVLAWSRAEDGRTPRELRPSSVGEIVAAVGPVLARRCEESGLAFDMRSAADGALCLQTDPARVSQILFNFADNACKYAGPGATVRLVIEAVGDRVVLAIEDSGPGVPDRLRARVFRAFDRGDRGPGDAVRGLGLGLAISTELAAALGGRLRCERSELGGARFGLELPISDAK
ncbi:MAG: HAMP domain-containing histidine kinase [Phycisphaerae bacterium]|jgi:signal transduction histidine kinase|nr:HAMP domain-containing histidine kinase [Phycisphaerae bacterium]